MMGRITFSRILWGAAAGLVWIGPAGCSHRNEAAVFDRASVKEGTVEISPDYQGVTIPPNIAPLNFKVLEPARRYLLRVHAPQGRPILVSSRSGVMRIPVRPWRELLSRNQGQALSFDLALQGRAGTWTRRATITNTIEKQPIDRYVAYRLLKPQYNYFMDIGVYQRDLEGFTRTVTPSRIAIPIE